MLAYDLTLLVSPSKFAGLVLDAPGAFKAEGSQCRDLDPVGGLRSGRRGERAASPTVKPAANWPALSSLHMDLARPGKGGGQLTGLSLGLGPGLEEQDLAGVADLDHHPPSDGETWNT